jgi:hypothetical protein
MNLEVGTFEREVTTVKEKAMAELAKDVQDQKESIRLLVSNANMPEKKLKRKK